MRFLLFIAILIIILPSAYSIDYFTDRMNFPDGESRSHTQNITNTESDSVQVNASIPSSFTLDSTDCIQINATLISCNIPPGQTRYYKMDSPSSCTESTLYSSELKSNSSFEEEFTFVCIPDNKITDCKVEYGHGDANYLSNSQLYISEETATIFNLLRVWNIGHFLQPDEAAEDATITCQYEHYPVRTYGRVEVDYYPNSINGTFHWEEIVSGYWFRIGVMSQEISGKSIGDYYNVTCNQLTYKFDHHQVIADPSSCNLEIRSSEPFVFTFSDHPTLENKSILKITNNEKYPVYDISFDRLLGGTLHTETYQQLNTGESVSYTIDESTSCNSTIFFIPSWYVNSLKPRYYTQQIDCSSINHPPTLDPIGDQTAYINITFTLDINATDIDGDNITFIDNTTLFNIVPQTGLINFTPTTTGNYSIEICAEDDFNATDCETIDLEILTSKEQISQPNITLTLL
ncbi:hypothetical protein GF336_03335, partial [Candidatus Woesearchaeota archaeon]|nr:hypothetical protein [Candidatus Woesearchaeota archaeon]